MSQHDGTTRWTEVFEQAVIRCLPARYELVVSTFRDEAGLLITLSVRGLDEGPMAVEVDMSLPQTLELVTALLGAVAFEQA